LIADRKDFEAIVQKRHAEAGNRMLPMARVLAGASPVMDKLARTEEWSRYCTYLQGIAENFAASKQKALAKLSDPGIVKDEEVRKLRQDVFEADVWLKALAFAIELPAEILKGGQEAEEFIKRMEKKNEAAGEAKP
jgi:hypothetical protein